MDDLSTKIHMSSNAEVSSTNNNVKLKKYLSEAVASLQVIADERDQIKNIVDIAHQELDVDKKVFRKTATFIHKNKTCAEEELVLTEVQNLIDKVSTIS